MQVKTNNSENYFTYLGQFWLFFVLFQQKGLFSLLPMCNNKKMTELVIKPCVVPVWLMNVITPLKPLCVMLLSAVNWSTMRLWKERTGGGGLRPHSTAKTKPGQAEREETQKNREKMSKSWDDGCIMEINVLPSYLSPQFLPHLPGPWGSRTNIYLTPPGKSL